MIKKEVSYTKKRQKRFTDNGLCGGSGRSRSVRELAEPKETRRSAGGIHSVCILVRPVSGDQEEGWLNRRLPGSSAEPKQWSTRFFLYGGGRVGESTQRIASRFDWSPLAGWFTRKWMCVWVSLLYSFLVVMVKGVHFKNNQNFNEFCLKFFFGFYLTFYFINWIFCLC